MKLLLDQGLPRSAATLLCGVGIDTVHVGDIGLSSADDAVILQAAHEGDRVVVTLDADFHALLALTGATTPSVIRIRIEGLRGTEMSDLLQITVLQCESELTRGAAVTVQETRIRVRHLPLVAGRLPPDG